MPIDLDVTRNVRAYMASCIDTGEFNLDRVQRGVALKVPLAELAESKEKVRSALNRATRKNGRVVATASDDTFLYVWNETP